MGQPVEPVHPLEPAQLHLTDQTTLLGLTEVPFNQLAFALADRAPWSARSSALRLFLPKLLLSFVYSLICGATPRWRRS
jgi:hypothetical protein